MSATDTTLATLRKVVAHAGEGALPDGWRFPEDEYDDEVDAILVMRDWDGTTQCIYDPDARDLCVGYWLRRLGEEGPMFGCDCFDLVAGYILSLHAYEARRVFAKAK